MAVPSPGISAKNAREGDVGSVGSDYGQMSAMNTPGSSVVRFATAKKYRSDSRDWRIGDINR
jgi:hypothetical protein